VDSSPDLESDIDATGIDQSDVVETGTDEERLADVANESTVPDSESDGLESEPDVPESESAITESKSESSDSAGGVSDSPDSAETEATESYERLGSASFDEHSGEIPVPQRAFDQHILSLRSEAFWGSASTTTPSSSHRNSTRFRTLAESVTSRVPRSTASEP